MKRILFILAFLSILLFSSCDEDPVGPQMGCMTGVPIGGTVRMNIKCCTREEFNAGSHMTANWNSFTSHQWKEVDNCSDCQ